MVFCFYKHHTRTKMKIVPTLNFGGNCREAIQMYEKAFNGNISCMITYGEANDPAYIPLLKENQKNYIYHSELVLENQRIIMSDHVDIEFQFVAIILVPKRRRERKLDE